LDRRVVPHEKYLVHAARIVLAAARRGNVVLVGRGGQFLLPREQGLAVRIVASEKYRTRRTMEKYALSEVQARQFIATVDRGRTEFVAQFFHHDVADPHLYDLVINVDFLGPDAAAEQIVAGWRQVEARRGTAGVPPSRPSPARWPR
jgi:cytidylate kinase